VGCSVGEAVVGDGDEGSAVVCEAVEGSDSGVVVVEGELVDGDPVAPFPLQVELDGQSHSFLLSFHSKPEGQGITTGVPVLLSALTVHWMKELQFSGLGYRQSFGPLQPVAAISSSEQGAWFPLPVLPEPDPPGVEEEVGAAVVGEAVDGSDSRVVVVVGEFVDGAPVAPFPLQVELDGQSHSFLLSFHSRPEGQGITTGVPVLLSALTVHWIKELQFSGLGYRQSFGPLQAVAAISSSEQGGWFWEPPSLGGAPGDGAPVVGAAVEGSAVEGSAVDGAPVVGCAVEALPEQVDSEGQSHSFLLSFHSRPAGQSFTVGLPLVLSALTSQWMKVLQLSGLGYRQSFGPIQPVAAMSDSGQWKSTLLAGAALTAATNTARVINLIIFAVQVFL
jgi:hypothetical protein